MPFYTDKINISAYGISHAHKSSAQLSKIIKEVIGVEKLGKINYKFFFWKKLNQNLTEIIGKL